MLMKRMLVAVLVIGACTMTAHAGLFVGGSVGDSSLNDSDTSLDFNSSETGYKIFAGFTFVKFFALEAAYVEFGSAEDEVAPGTDAKIDPTGWDVYVVGKLPLGKHFDLFAKAGVIVWDAESSFSGAINGSSDENGNDLCYGAGFSIIFAKHFAIRAEYERFDIADVDKLEMTSVGAEFRF